MLHLENQIFRNGKMVEKRKEKKIGISFYILSTEEFNVGIG